jgi:hypothetical protein
MKTFNSFLPLAVAIVGLVGADKVKGARGRLNAESARLQDRILTGSDGGIKRRTKTCKDDCSNVAQKLNKKYTKLLQDIEQLNEEVDKFNNCEDNEGEVIGYSCDSENETCNEQAEDVGESEEIVDVFVCDQEDCE